MLLCKFLAGKDHTTSRSAQCLMCCGCCNMCIWDRTLMIACSDKSRNMSHINHQKSTNFIGDLAETLEVDLSGICTCTGYDQLWLAFLCDALYLIIVDEAFVVDTVRNTVEVFTGKVNRASVCQMSAVIQVHSHESITRIHECKKYSHICLSTGMWLYICVSAAEQLHGSVSGKILYYINVLASAVITLARITLCILIGESASHSRHYCLADKVLRCDQLDVFALSVGLSSDRCCNFRIKVFYVRKWIHVFSSL